MSPLLKKVEKAGIRGIRNKRKPYQIVEEDFFKDTETLRALFSRLIENETPERVVTIPSVSYGLANVVTNIPFTDGEILVVQDQFPSNYYAWEPLVKKGLSLKTIEPEKENRGASWNQKILESINAKTRIVAIGHIHWSDGTLFNLREINKRVKEVGGLLIVDGTQSVGAMPFSIREIEADALICGGYKWLMGPYALGLAYYGPFFENGQPLEENWINREASNDFAHLTDYQARYRSGMLRYEVGEHSNFILVPMLIEGIKQLLRWEPDNIQKYCADLTRDALRELTEMGYGIEKEEGRSKHLFGIKCPKGLAIEKVKESARQQKVSLSYRGEFIRISPHVYNDEIDIRKLVKALKAPIFAENS